MVTIATLTCSRTHGSYESIYPLLKAINDHGENYVLWVVDRSDSRNSEFFGTKLNPIDAGKPSYQNGSFNKTTVYGKIVDSEFSYSKEARWFKDSSPLDLNTVDAIFLRMDRPFDDDQLLKLKGNFSNCVIINDPVGIINTGSKEYLLNFPTLCPSMKVCGSIKQAINFLEKQDAVFKPFHGFGGQGIIRFSDYGFFDGEKSVTRDEAIKILSKRISNGEKYLAMEYMYNVREGDKRVVVVGNKILGATLRMPAENSDLCNLKAGGTAHPAKPDSDEMLIAETLMPYLSKEGILIYGFDTLVNNEGKRILSEINTLNVGGFLQAEEFSGDPVIQWAAIEFCKFMDMQTS